MKMETIYLKVTSKVICHIGTNDTQKQISIIKINPEIKIKTYKTKLFCLRFCGLFLWEKKKLGFDSFTR